MQTTVEADSQAVAKSKSFSLSRLGRLIVWLVAISISLVVFPAAVGWMVAGWLCVYTVRVLRGQTAWLPTTITCSVLLVKGLYQHWALWLLMVSLIMPVIFCCLAKRKIIKIAPLPAHRCFAVLAWLALLAFAYSQIQSVGSRPVTTNPDGPIVCIGDSLTSGVNPYGGYPNVLAGQVDTEVINHGREGITTEKGVKMLAAVRALKPRAVIIELGGHDYLTGASRSTTASNLEQIIVACQQMGAVPILMEIPRGAISDPYFGIERALAAKHQIPLIQDTPIRWLVYRSKPAPTRWLFFWAPPLSDDGIHPNDQGNGVLADYVAGCLRRYSLTNPSL